MSNKGSDQRGNHSLKEWQQKVKDLSQVTLELGRLFQKMITEKEMETSGHQETILQLNNWHQQEIKTIEEAKLRIIEELEEKLKDVQGRCEFQEKMIATLLERNQCLEATCADHEEQSKSGTRGSYVTNQPGASSSLSVDSIVNGDLENSCISQLAARHPAENPPPPP